MGAGLDELPGDRGVVVVGLVVVGDRLVVVGDGRVRVEVEHGRVVGGHGSSGVCGGDGGDAGVGERAERE